MAKMHPLIRISRKVRSRQQWDRYCFWLAVIGGNLAGILFVLPALSMALGGPLWSVAWHRGMMRLANPVLMYTIAALACAPPRRLLWCFVPPALWLVWSVMDRVALHNWLGLVHDLHNNVLASGMSLVFGGFLALVLGKLGRGLEEEQNASESALISVSPEGVWPPAPRQRE
jgi:hypothetical protein